MTRVVLKPETANKLKELFRSENDDDAETGTGNVARSAASNRVTLVYANSDTGVTHNSYDWFEGLAVVLDGDQNGIVSTDTVYLIQQTNDLVTSRYFVAVECGAIPDPAPAGLTAGTPVFMVPVPAQDTSPPGIYLADGLYNPVAHIAAVFGSSTPLIAFDSGQGLRMITTTGASPYPATSGGYPLLLPYVTINDATPSGTGVVNFTTQGFAGVKTFQDTVNIAQPNLVGVPTRYLTIGGTTCQYVSSAGGVGFIVYNHTTDFGWGLGLTNPVKTVAGLIDIGSGNTSAAFFDIKLGTGGDFNIGTAQAASSALYIGFTCGLIGGKGGTSDNPATVGSGQLACFTVGSSEGQYGTDPVGNVFKGGICTTLSSTSGVTGTLP